MSGHLKRRLATCIRVLAVPALVVLACSAACEAESTEGDASDGNPSECLPPRDAAGCTPSRMLSWSRHPETGTCCVYEGSCRIPTGWSQFDSPEECESSCRCQSVTPTELERTSLECLCSEYDCPASLAEAATAACKSENAAVLSQRVGCGMTFLPARRAFAGINRVFDATSGGLIGTTIFGDLPIAPCLVYHVLAGVDFDCAEAVECPLCDGATPRLDGCE